MIEEESDAAAFYAGREAELERPEEAQWPLWAGHIRAAWEDLRDDRHYGAMGGLGRIWFHSIKGYAESYEISGSAFDEFLTLLRACDDEYVAVQNERAKAEAEKNKTK